MKRITHEFLRSRDACSEQCDLVEKHWPNGAPVTVPTFRKALRLGLNVEWLANLLPAPALAEYEAVKAPARAEYRAAIAPAWAEYQAARATALVPFIRALDIRTE